MTQISEWALRPPAARKRTKRLVGNNKHFREEPPGVHEPIYF